MSTTQLRERGHAATTAALDRLPVTRPSGCDTSSRIGVAAIGGRVSDELVEVALDLASASRSSVDVVSVVPFPVDCESLPCARHKLARVIAAETERLDDLAGRSAHDGVGVNFAVCDGRPANVLSRLADRVDTLVVGVRVAPWIDRKLDELALRELTSRLPGRAIITVPVASRPRCPRARRSRGNRGRSAHRTPAPTPGA